MTLQQLEYAVAVDEMRHFTRAAERMHVTQATLSAMVKKLEEEWGVVLFDRKTNPVVTTHEGALLLDEARKVLAQSRRLADIAGSLHGRVQGQLRLGIIPTIGSALLPRILPVLTARFPDLRFEIHELTTPVIVEQLRQGLLDGGILATPIGSSGLEEQVLYYESLYVYGRKPGDKAYLLPSEVQAQALWMLEEGHCLRDQFMHLCSLKSASRLPAGLQLEAGNLETLLGMVDAFGGLTLLPELHYHQMAPARQEKVAYFQQPIPVREVSLVYHRPYAKQGLLHPVAAAITETIRPLLRSSAFHNSELHITPAV